MSGFVERNKKKGGGGGGWMGGLNQSGEGVDPGPVVTKSGPRCVCRGTTGGAWVGGWGEVALRPVAAKHLPRPPNGLTNATTSLSLVNEQPAHPAELAGKPPPEGTKVFVMELLEFGGLADVT